MPENPQNREVIRHGERYLCGNFFKRRGERNNQASGKDEGKSLLLP